MSDEKRFTKEEIEAAANTDLPSLLESLGYSVYRIGSYYTAKEMDSLRIKNRKTWFRYSEQVGGDAITFLQHFHGMSFSEAMEYLCGKDNTQKFSNAGVKSEEAARPVFALPKPYPTNRRVYAYLRKRDIAPQVINEFINAGLLYEEASHHNCVFVGKDAADNAVFASMRGTMDLDGKGFKGGVTGSDKNIAFRTPCDPSDTNMFVFEAPIDLMSFLTLDRSSGTNAVALCCLYDGPVDSYLRDYPHIKNITLCLDNDHWGLAAAERMKEKYSALGYMVGSATPREGKDWNECLQRRSKKSHERGWDR